MNKKNKYLAFDDLCKVFFARGDIYSDNGRFIGNSFGQAIRNFRDENWSIGQNTLTDQEKRVINDIILAKQDNAPVADTFLKQIDILTGVAGTVTKSLTCAITKCDVDSLFDYINKYSHDPSAVSCVLDYLRKFCASCDITGCLWAKLTIAQMAIKWNCAQYMDYSIMASQYHSSNQHRSIIKPLLNTARKDIQSLAANSTYKAQYEALQICNDVIYRFSSMAIPMALITVVGNEFGFVRSALQGKKPVNVPNEFSENTDKVVSDFLKDGYLDSDIADEFYVVMHRQDLIGPALNNSNSDIKNAIILAKTPVVTEPVNNETATTKPAVTNPTVKEQPAPEKISEPVKAPDVDQPTVEVTAEKEPEQNSETPVEKTTIVTKIANFARSTAKKMQKETANDEPRTNIGLHSESESTNAPEESYSEKTYTAPVVDNTPTESNQSVSIHSKAKVKAKPAVDEAFAGIGLYSEAKPTGFLSSLLGRRR